jgi:hypothetical protein
MTVASKYQLSRFPGPAAIFLDNLLNLSTSIGAALMMCWRPNLHRLVPLDRVDQGLLPMKQLFGGAHLEP